MTTQIEPMNHMILKVGLEELSAEYQDYWGKDQPVDKVGHEKNPLEYIVTRAISLIGCSVFSFGVLYLLAVLLHYMMEHP
jgi:hypothetical protein